MNFHFSEGLAVRLLLEKLIYRHSTLSESMMQIQPVDVLAHLTKMDITEQIPNGNGEMLFRNR